jgi:hypothetical protein
MMVDLRSEEQKQTENEIKKIADTISRLTNYEIAKILQSNAKDIALLRLALNDAKDRIRALEEALRFYKQASSPFVNNSADEILKKAGKE